MRQGPARSAAGDGHRDSQGTGAENARSPAWSSMCGLPDSREPPRRRHGDSPGISGRRWRSRSTSRRVQPRREDSGRSHSQRARRRSRRDSRSPSRRRRRSRSRRSRRPKEARQGRRMWPSEDKQGLQESRRWAGRDHAQEASRHSKAGFQDWRQAQGRHQARPDWPPNRGYRRHDHHHGQGGKQGKGKGPSRAEERGGGAKDPKASTPTTRGGTPPGRRSSTGTSLAARRGPPKGSGKRPPPSTTSCGTRCALGKPRKPVMRTEVRQIPAGPHRDLDKAPKLCGTIGPERAAPGRREPGTRPGDPFLRTWRRRWPSGSQEGGSCSVYLRASPAVCWQPPTDRPVVGVSAGCPGNLDEADGRCPGWPHRVAPLARMSRSGHRVVGARHPLGNREKGVAPGPSRGFSKRARGCGKNGDPRPNHDRFQGTRVGEAPNPRPTPLAPWDPDPDHTSRFAIFGEGWVVFVLKGLHGQGGGPPPSFRAVAPLGGRAATFHIMGEGHLFNGLVVGQAYACAEAKPVLPHWEGAHEFQVGHPGSRPAVVEIRMAPSGLAWTTSDPKWTNGPWTHADLACGISGFTVTTQALGATTTWARDIKRTAVEAYNAAHSHALTRPAECHPIELRTRWGRHVGTDIISAGFPCQAFSKVGLRQGYRDARGQVIFHLIQICWVLRPRFMVLECVWLSRTPSGLNLCATISAPWGMGSLSGKNKSPTTWPRFAPGVPSRQPGRAKPHGNP